MKWLLFALAAVVWACSGSPDSGDPDGSTDSDSDSDTDGDIDTDCSGDGICDDPPDSFCSEDGTQFIEYTGEATCTAGECNYSTVAHDCTADEWEGDCVIDSIDNEAKCNDPCVNYDCSWAAIPHCLPDMTYLIVYSNPQCTLDGPGDSPVCGFDDSNHVLTPCPNGCVVVEDGPDYCQE
ncbi:MAG: hypothetical protein M0R80_26435 [Proteobacteria bacterium]|nr:hypothetical protein [Pseudomonadota bacterium]